MREVVTYVSEKAIVRVYPSKMPPEEFRANLEAACRKFYSELMKANAFEEKEKKQ